VPLNNTTSSTAFEEYPIFLKGKISQASGIRSNLFGTKDLH